MKAVRAAALLMSVSSIIFVQGGIPYTAYASPASAETSVCGLLDKNVETRAGALIVAKSITKALVSKVTGMPWLGAVAGWVLVHEVNVNCPWKQSWVPWVLPDVTPSPSGGQIVANQDIFTSLFPDVPSIQRAEEAAAETINISQAPGQSPPITWASVDTLSEQLCSELTQYGYVTADLHPVLGGADLSASPAVETIVSITRQTCSTLDALKLNSLLQYLTGYLSANQAADAPPTITSLTWDCGPLWSVSTEPEITLKWSASSQAGSPVFELDWRAGQENWQHLTDSTLTTQTIRISDPQQTYFFAVRAINTAGWPGPWVVMSPVLGACGPLR